MDAALILGMTKPLGADFVGNRPPEVLFLCTYLNFSPQLLIYQPMIIKGTGLYS